MSKSRCSIEGFTRSHDDSLRVLGLALQEAMSDRSRGPVSISRTFNRAMNATPLGGTLAHYGREAWARGIVRELLYEAHDGAGAGASHGVHAAIRACPALVQKLRRRGLTA